MAEEPYELTIERDGDALSAVEIGPTPRKVFVDSDEVSNFLLDCRGIGDYSAVLSNLDGYSYTELNLDRLNAGYQVSISMNADDWESWLAAFELDEVSSSLDEEAIATPAC